MPDTDSRMDHFTKTVYNLITVYINELATLTRQCEAFTTVMTNTLKEQAKVCSCLCVGRACFSNTVTESLCFTSGDQHQGGGDIQQI